LHNQRNRLFHRRSFGALVLLSVITFGIYYLYWLCVNLVELGTFSTEDDLRRSIRRGKLFFFLYLTLIVVWLYSALSIAINYLATRQGVPEISPLVWVLLVPQVGIELGLYYFFSLTIVRGLAFVKLGEEPVSRLYALIVVVMGLDIVMAAVSPGPDWRDYRDYRLGAIIPLALVSLGFLLTHFSRCQNSINRIWERSGGVPPGPKADVEGTFLSGVYTVRTLRRISSDSPSPRSLRWQ